MQPSCVTWVGPKSNEKYSHESWRQEEQMTLNLEAKTEKLKPQECRPLPPFPVAKGSLFEPPRENGSAYILFLACGLCVYGRKC